MKQWLTLDNRQLISTTAMLTACLSFSGCNSGTSTQPSSQNTNIAANSDINTSTSRSASSIPDNGAPIGGNECFGLVTQSNNKLFTNTLNANQYYSSGQISFGVKNLCTKPAIMSNLSVNLPGDYDTRIFDNSYINQAGSPNLTIAKTTASSNVNFTLSSPVCNQEYCSSSYIPAGTTYTVSLNGSYNGLISKFTTNSAALSYSPLSYPPVGGNSCFSLVTQSNGSKVMTNYNSAQYYSTAKLSVTVKNICPTPAILSNYKINLLGATINGSQITNLGYLSQDKGSPYLTSTSSLNGNAIQILLNNPSGSQTLAGTEFNIAINTSVNTAINKLSVLQVNSSNDSASTNLVAVGTYGYVAKGSESTWSTLRYPMINYTSVAYGNGTYVAAGDVGMIIASKDGIIWNTVDSKISQRLSNVSYINGKFVAVGAGGVVVTSVDGVEWDKSLTLPVSYALNSVTGDSSNYLAVGGNGLIYLINPSNVGSGRITSPTTQNLNSIVYGNGLFVAVGNQGTIITSSNGKTWQLEPATTISNLNQVIYTHGKFYAVGKDGLILVSENGRTWQSYTIKNSILNIYDFAIGSNGNYINLAFGGFGGKYANIASSTNLDSWSNYQGITTTYLLNSLDCGSACVIVGNTGTNLTSINNGASWMLLKQGLPNSLTEVAIKDNLWVAVGNNGVIQYSNDRGDIWQTATSPTSSNLTDVKYINDKFLAIGDTGIILTSTNGINWSINPSGTTAKLNGLAYTSNKVTNQYSFVIVGNAGSILASADGSSWTSLNSGITSNLYSVAYNALLDNFEVTGDTGTVLQVSRAGQVSKSNTNSPANLRTIASTFMSNSNGEFQYVTLTAGTAGSILWSGSTSVWNSIKCGTYTGSFYNSITTGNAIYLSGDNGTIGKVTFSNFSSPQCTLIKSPTAASLWGLSSI